MSQPNWVAGHDARARGLEKDAAEIAEGIIRPALAIAARQLTRAYIDAAGDLNSPVPPHAKAALRVAVLHILADLVTGLGSRVPALGRALMDIARRGLRLGEQTERGTPAGSLSRDVRDRVAGLHPALTAALGQVVAFARRARLDTFSDVTVVLARAHTALNTATSVARHVANRSINDGAAAAADHSGGLKLWLAESDACLACLAYSGELAGPDGLFQPGRTFGDKSYVTEPVESPPLHPHCRCRILSYSGMDVEVGISFPDALKREAQRSVLLGRSEYASRPAKLRAADRLLTLGAPKDRRGRRLPTGLPQTVKVRARRQVATGVKAYKPARRG